MSQKHSIIIVKSFITKLYKLTGRDKGMEKFLVDRIDRTVDNYRLAKEYLKNDGDILNHFASLVFSHYEKEIPIDRIKEIRKEIKAATPRMSPFRGDILYIISLLIATTDKEIQQEIIENMFSAMEKLEENGFIPCSHLVLTAYVIGRYGSARKQDEIVYKLKESYILLKEKYNNITNEDDYLLCALWSINNIELKVVNDFIENVYDHVADYNVRTKNGVQGLSNAIILNGSSGQMYRNMEFLLQLQKRDIKIANQFLPLVGVLSNTNPRRTVDLVEGVIEDLCDKEAEYEFYLDKGFRTIIAVVIVSFCTISDKRRYIDELLAHGVISFINSKNKGIFEEALS